MAFTELPPAAFLRECFAYDPDTGALRWRERPDRHFASAAIARGWNKRFAGVDALIEVDKDGYRRGELAYDGRRYRVRAARAIVKMQTGVEPEIVDHRNLDKADNRWENLRAATALGNSRNVFGRRDKPLPKGVFVCGAKFRASYHHEGRKRHIGTYNCPTRAYFAYCAVVRRLHGEFFNPGHFAVLSGKARDVA